MNHKWTVEITNQFLKDYLQMQNEMVKGRKDHIAKMANRLIQNLQPLILQSDKLPEEKMKHFLNEQGKFCNELNQLWSTGHKHDDIEKYFKNLKGFLSKSSTSIISNNYFENLKSNPINNRRQYIQYFISDVTKMNETIRQELDDIPVPALKTFLTTPTPVSISQPTFEMQSQFRSITLPNLAEKTSIVPFISQNIAAENLHVSELIGSGSYGDVYLGTWLGISVAIKQLHVKTLPTSLSVEFEQETKIMAQCQFPNIVRLYGVCIEPERTAMVMEYLPKGSLYQVLHDAKDPFFWNPIRWNIAIDIGKGLVYLHGQKIIHRDLKSLNVLLDEQYQAKISDFGLSKVKLESNSTSSKTQKSMGTTRWRAPELFKRGVSANFASDVYSYGMILWEIASRQLPYQDAPDDTMAMGWIKDGEKENIPSDCPKEYGDIIQQCWETVDKRPTAQRVTELLTNAKPEGPVSIAHASKPYVEKSWHFDRVTKTNHHPAPTEIYKIVEATDKDKNKVVQFYQHHSVPGYDIAAVHVIYNPDMNHKFNLYLKELQQRNNNPAFEAKWPTGREGTEGPSESAQHIAWRKVIYQKYQTLAEPHKDSDYPAVNLLPVWHGTQKTVINSICTTGYANLATTDQGYFGKGIYGTHEAEYAYRVYSKDGGVLILNWTACFSPYPVIHGDLKKLEGKNNYSNYDAHFVPVVPLNRENPNEDKYYPTRIGEEPEYHEMVVFQSAGFLPRYVVELQSTLIKSPPPPVTDPSITSVSTSGYPGTFFLTAEQQNEEKQPTQISVPQSPYSTRKILN